MDSFNSTKRIKMITKISTILKLGAFKNLGVYAKNFLMIIALFTCFYSNAGINSKTTSLNGLQIKTGAVLSIEDEYLNYMASTPDDEEKFVDASIQNIIRFKRI